MLFVDPVEFLATNKTRCEHGVDLQMIGKCYHTQSRSKLRKQHPTKTNRSDNYPTMAVAEIDRWFPWNSVSQPAQGGELGR